MAINKLSLKELKQHPYLQLRAGLDHHWVEQLARLLTSGGTFRDPIVVYRIGAEYFTVDGHHRVAASHKANKRKIEAVVHGGTLEEARAYAETANIAHGMGLTTAERFEVFKSRVLREFQYTFEPGNSVWFWCLSNKALSAILNVDESTVRKWRGGEDFSALALPITVYDLAGNAHEIPARISQREEPVSEFVPDYNTPLNVPKTRIPGTAQPTGHYADSPRTLVRTRESNPGHQPPPDLRVVVSDEVRQTRRVYATLEAAINDLLAVGDARPLVDQLTDTDTTALCNQLMIAERQCSVYAQQLGYQTPLAQLVTIAYNVVADFNETTHQGVNLEALMELCGYLRREFGLQIPAE